MKHTMAASEKNREIELLDVPFARPPPLSKKRKTFELAESLSPNDPCAKVCDQACDANLQKQILSHPLVHLLVGEPLQRVWEKQPAVFRKVLNAEEIQVMGVSYENLIHRAEEEELLFEHHINACKYVDGARQGMNPPAGEEGFVRATAKIIKKLWKDGATFQQHQPQHHSTVLQQLMSVLESLFGSLVGSNAYITPPHSQGLPPHHDDIEAFVIQLEGKKTWNLHAPIVELAHTYSNDLHVSSLGPSNEVTLIAGDVMYFPRGTVHYARSGTSSSTHLTMSTCQDSNIGSFLSSVLPVCIHRALPTCLELRQGIPFGLLASKDEKRKADVEKMISSVLRSEVVLQELYKHLGEGVHASAIDFVKNRLPPSYPTTPSLLATVENIKESVESPEQIIPQSSKKKSKHSGNSNTKNRSTRAPEVGLGFLLRHPSYVCVTEEPSPISPEETITALYHCLENRVESHMLPKLDVDGDVKQGSSEDCEMGGEDAEEEEEEEEADGEAGASASLYMPLYCKKVVQHLLKVYPTPVTVSSLAKATGVDEEAVVLAMSALAGEKLLAQTNLAE